MRRNQYAGIIEPWKLRLISGRARRRGFRGEDLDEVVQRIVIALLDFQFDESRSNGAKEATAVTAIVDRQLAFYWRGESRYRKHVDQAALKSEPSIDYRNTFDESLDVQKAIASLPKCAQQVCAALGNGLSIRETAKKLGMSGHTVDRQVRFIRRHLERCGFEPERDSKEAAE